MVPSGWEVKKFGDLFNVKSGFGFKHSEYADSGTPLIKIDNVSHGYVKWNNVSYLPDSYREEYSDILLKEGDLLLALNRPITQGKLKLVKLTKNDVPSILYQRVGRIDFKTNDLEKDFYLYLLDTAIYRFVSHKAIGSDQPFISTTELKKLNIVKPPLPEQRKIAKILSTWDKAISTTERLIDNSKHQKKALMQTLLTGKKRLLDDSGKPFEGEWEEVKLSNVAEVVMGSSPKSASYNDNSEGLPLIQGNADIKNRKSVPRTYTSEVTKKCRIGDILLSVRAPVGTIAKSEHEACIGRGISAISTKKHHVQEYLYQWLLWFEPRWEKYSQGSTFEAVNSNDIKSLHLTVPSHSEQVKISVVLSSADQEIELLEQQLADLKQEKKALMQQMLTGKRRVKI
jgi:type I restriction enzyme S subunit